MFLITAIGQVNFLSCALNHKAPTDLILHLYSNNKQPAVTDTISQYLEVTASGYAPITLLGLDWTISVNSLNVAVATYPIQVFSFTSAVASYGYYITDTTGLLLYLAESFSSPVSLPSGSNIKVQPTITFGC